MKIRFGLRALMILFVCLFILGAVAVERGFALSTSYSVSTDYHGIDVPVGKTVTATAVTNNLQVTGVEFIWKDPKGNIVKDTVGVSGQLTTPTTPPSPVCKLLIDWCNKYPGVTYIYARDTLAPNVVGEWTVQAIFIDAKLTPKGKSLDVIRATSFPAIPEVTFGTTAMLLGMFGALGLYMIDRKRSLTPG